MSRLLIIILLFIFTFQLQAEVKQDTILKRSIMVAGINIHPDVKSVTREKIHAAFNLAARLSEKYYMIPVDIVDSLAIQLKNSDIEPSAINLFTELNADKMAFISVNEFQNILRAEVVEADTSGELSRGEGFALIRYQKGSGEKVTDPSLLKALQRAFASAEGDSAIYSHLTELAPDLYAKPAPTLVVGGLEFKDNAVFDKWSIFHERVATSFDAVEVMFEEILDNPEYVVYDMATRDSVYALFNMFMVENYNAPSVNELDALEKFGVDKYLTGTFKRTKEGGEINLMLCNIENKRLRPVKTITGTIKDDKLTVMRDELRRLMKELLTEVQ